MERWRVAHNVIVTIKGRATCKSKKDEATNYMGCNFVFMQPSIVWILIVFFFGIVLFFMFLEFSFF